MLLRRTVVTIASVLVLVLSACTDDSSGRSAGGAMAAEPSASATVFEQQIVSVLSGDPTEISVSGKDSGKPV